MRYALYCGEPMFTGFFRLRPGPRFWTCVYLAVDFGSIWPYVSANAAVPLAAAFLGHLPAALPTTYLSVEQVVAESGLQRSVVEEMSEHPERFGLARDIALKTGLPQDVVDRMEREPEKFGRTQAWRPFPRPITRWTGQESVDEVVARTGLSRVVVEQVQRNPHLFATEQEVISQTGLPPPIVEDMALRPEGYRSTRQWKPFPGSVMGRWIGPERRILSLLGYAIFISALLPLAFGGKIYDMVERIMATKSALVLGYLTFLGLFYVDWWVWVEIFSGFVKFGALPAVEGHQISWSELVKGTFGIGGQEPVLDVALLAIFAAIAGSGGLGNASFSNYVRDKGWGMGQRVGAIASAVGGKDISLSHQGMVFEVTPESKRRWKVWRRVTIRDQLGVWFVGCMLGMGIPALLSLQFAAGRQVRGDFLAALTAEGIVQQTGAPIYGLLTLLCGFVILAPGQTGGTDSFVRRWTDLIWTASRRARKLDDRKVNYIYYALLTAYALWGLVTLTLIPDRMMIVKIGGIPFNFALGFSAFHTLAVNCIFLPRELRPSWFMRLCLLACGLFFVTIACFAAAAVLRDLGVVG